MKKTTTFLLSLILGGGIFSQQAIPTPEGKTLTTPTNLENTNFQHQNSQNKTLVSQWVNYHDAYSGQYGSGPNFAINYLFPDSTILVNYGQAGYSGTFVHSIAQTFHMGAPAYANTGININGNYPIEIDSIEVIGIYERPDNSVVDTLAVRVVPMGANLSTLYYFSGGNVNTNLNSDTVFFLGLDYDSVNHVVRNNVSTYKVPLDDAFFNTINNGVHTVKINANDIIPDSSFGVFAIVVDFIPGYSWTPNVDTIGTQKNGWIFGSYELNGSNTYPNYSKDDYNVGSIINSAVRYNNAGSWNGSYLPSYAFMGTSPGYAYESMAIAVKLKQHQPVSLADCSEPFFSEYVEGSSNNKALEIFNPTGSNINLSNYEIRKYVNGSTTPSTLSLSGTLASNDVFVITNPNATFTGDLADNFISFNGDDALELYNTQTSTVVDVIGVVGVDPGSSWTVGTGSTANHTLVRKVDVKVGTDVWTGIVDQQWDVYPSNTNSYLGSHTNNGCFTPLTANITIDFDTLCVGGTIQFSATATGGSSPYSYSWNFGDGNTSTSASGSYTYGTAGTYTVTLTVTDGSSNTATSTSTVLVAPAPNANFSFTGQPSVTFTDLSTVSVGTIASWAWDFGDGGSSVVQNPVYTYNADGTYSVVLIVTSSLGCIDSTTQNVTVSVGGGTSINENIQDYVSVYPNPAKYRVEISSPLSISTIELLDVTGKRVYTSNGNNLSIDLSNLANGVYSLRVNTEKGIHTQKLIIRK